MWNLPESTKRSVSFQYFRLRVLALRNGASGSAIKSIGLTSWGLMHQNCEIPARENGWVDGVKHVEDRQGSIAYLNFSTPVLVDGWFVVTSNMSVEMDPSTFVVEALEDGEWQILGLSHACGWRPLVELEEVQISSDKLPSFTLPKERVKTVKFLNADSRCVWGSCAQMIGRYVEGISLLLAVLAIRKGWFEWPVKLISVAFFIGGVVKISSYAAIYDLWEQNNQIVFMVNGLADIFVFPAPLFFDESFILETAILAQVIKLPVNNLSGDNVGTASILTMTSAFVFLLIRHRTRVVCTRQMREMKEKFDSAWNVLLQEAGNYDALLALDNLVADLEMKSHWMSTPRQLRLPYPQRNAPADPTQVQREALTSEDVNGQSSTSDNEAGRPSSGRAPLVIERNSPMLSAVLASILAQEQRVTSLDQLYARSVTVQPLFASKIVELAESCEGSFMFFDNDNLMSARDVKKNADMMSLLTKLCLKPLERTVEKLVGAYDGDVSRLTDLVRQRIVFDSFSNILQCLQTISSDPTIEIVQVKNRFRPDDDAVRSAGYRDLCVRLRLRTDETLAMGLAGYVCELQLFHRRFVSILNEMDHEVYLKFRRVLRMEGIYKLQKFRSLFTRSKVLCSSSVRCVGLSQVCVAREEEDEQRQQREGGGENGEQEENADGQVQEEEEEEEEEEENEEDVCEDRARQILKYRCLLPGNILESRLNQFYHAVKTAGTASVLFTQIPCTLATQKPWVKIFLFATSIYLQVIFFGPGGFLQQFLGNNVFEGTSFRFSSLQTRNGSLPADSGVASIGLLLNGCRVTGTFKFEERGTDFFLLSSNPVSANGWFFHVKAEQPRSLDPVRFRLDVTSSMTPSLPSSSWKTVSASHCVWDIGSSRCLPLPEMVFPTSSSPSVANEISLHIPWFNALGSIFIYIPVFVFVFLVPVFATLGRTSLTLLSFGLAFFIPGVIEVIVGAASFSNSPLSLLYWLFLGFSSIVFGLILNFKEAYTMTYVPIHFIFCFTGLQVQNYLVYRNNSFQLPLTASIFALVWLLFVVLRFFALRKAREEVSMDMNKYSELWQRTKEGEEASELLSRLSRMGREFNMSKRARHLKKRLSTSAISTAMEHFPAVNESFRRKQPALTKVWSMDQVYAQAFLLQPLFLHKVQQLALRSRGCFLADSNEFELVRWEGVSREEKLRRRVKFATVKSVDRAMEKASRSYTGDVSRLTDIVRQCIVFTSLKDLVSCFDEVIKDDELLVLRVKNRFDDSYDANFSAGYRDLCINVLLRSELAASWGLSGHVCELQLTLEEFKEWSWEGEGHKRYVKYRNKRCE
ncbi:hypothetical protein GUITHDRAFT_121390 [Guillardia theta CCMP2712]|uniref:Uncharacterized protein n=2 Tax=Guillardia theta TaxID=55529 RepID=L1I874_GUITC|nr:hypothetical protein GUITHDRAFT_121390 [Guillardia theta CCMP2712]EKX32423.1 hypothetical protein GUITHDRAFT_121390 [Guillardia theta CCMP2712]|eukprot:XP_005819403.1 hypothetical protein GUITHDRAFT_121390 [Guillardia theta CCMP2712]